MRQLEHCGTELLRFYAPYVFTCEFKCKITDVMVSLEKNVIWVNW